MSREREILQKYDASLRTPPVRHGLREMDRIDHAKQEALYDWTGECLSILKREALGNEILAQPMTRVPKIDMNNKSHTTGDKLSLGYILPLAPDNEQHLVVFKSGKMITVEPEEGRRNASLYKDCMIGNGSEPLVITDPDVTETSVFELFNSGLFGTKVLEQNDTKAKVSVFDRYIEKALEVSIDLKSKKDMRRIERLDAECATVTSLRSQLRKIFPK